MQERRVQSLCQENPREQKMATCSSILARKIPGTEEPGRLQSMALRRVRQNWAHEVRGMVQNSWPELFTSVKIMKGREDRGIIINKRRLWMEEPGGLQSMGSLRVGHDWVTSLSLFTFMHWRRKWQPTPMFLPGESQGRGSLVGCHLWGRTELDTAEAT